MSNAARIFLTHFNRIAEAPGGVPKLRTVVFDLATAGLLVAHAEANDEQSQSIATQKAQALKKLGITRHPDTTLVLDGELPFKLPESWSSARLGDLVYSCPTSYGENPSPDMPTAGVITVGNIANAGGFKGEFSPRSFLPEEIDELLARKGDLIVVKSSGSAENVHSGKAALCRDEHDGKIVGTNFVIRLRAFGNLVLPEFLWLILSSPINRSWVKATVQTMTYPNLKWSEYSQLPIGFPPLAEQRRIVAKVEELMRLCDALEAAQQEREAVRKRLRTSALHQLASSDSDSNSAAFVLQNLPHLTAAPGDLALLRKSVLKLAVQGKLGTQLQNEKVGSSISEILPEPFPFVAPSNWRWTEFGEIATIAGGFAFKSSDYTQSGVFVLRVTNIEPTGRITKDEAVFLPEEKITPEIERFYLNEGDILLVMVGGSLGKIGVVIKDVLPALLNQNLWRITPTNEEVDRRFLKLLTDFIVSFQREITHSTHGHLSREDFRKKSIPLPPLAEQRRIVAKVDELMAVLDALEAALTTARTTSEKLLAATVAALTAA